MFVRNSRISDASETCILIMDNLKRFSYHDQQEIEITEKIRDVLTDLPPYIRDFYRGRKNSTSVRTRLSYSYDLKVFFQFLKQSNPKLADKHIKDISLEDLEQLTLLDFEEYQEYLELYTDPETNEIKKNGPGGISRKLSTLRSLFAFLYKHDMLSKNETVKIEMPEIKEKDIIRLEPDEVAELLDYVENCGSDLSPHQQNYYNKTASRDIAILTLLLGTGLRVSECVGLNIDDVDFKNDNVRIIRKGGKEMSVYFGDEVHDALDNYLSVRGTMNPREGHEQALFLSMRQKRISVDSVENIVKKYVKIVSPLKHITPHKLRSTYGSNLYAETGDIYLVADVLGHNDVNTTKKHYAALSEDRRRYARDKVKLREK